MKNRIILVTVLSAFTGLMSASGVTGSGTLQVTADIQGSILVTFTTDVAGLAVTGTGTSAGTLPFGTQKMFGGAPGTGVTKVVTIGTGFTLSTPVDIEVDVANTNTTNYTLSAALNAADANHTWTFNNVVLTATPAAVDATGTYGQANSYVFILGVPQAYTAGANTVSNTINFTATAN